MSGDAIGSSFGSLGESGTVERRIQSFSGPGKEEQIAQQIKRHVNRLNELFVEAKKNDLQVEIDVLSGSEMAREMSSPESDVRIMITKLRIEKDF